MSCFCRAYLVFGKHKYKMKEPMHIVRSVLIAVCVLGYKDG